MYNVLVTALAESVPREFEHLILPDENYREFVPYLHSILGILQMLEPEKSKTFLDYGCGQGFWTLCGSVIFGESVGLDINQSSLTSAKNLLKVNSTDNYRLINSASHPLSNLPCYDAMLSVMVIELARSDHLLDMFCFVSKKLRPGGLFLCMSRRPAGLLVNFLTLDRIKLEGFIKGSRRMLALSRSAFEALIFPKISNSSRARFYHKPKGVISAAARFGLSLKYGPEDLSQNEAFMEFESYFNSSPIRIRTVDWYLFEKR